MLRAGGRRELLVVSVPWLSRIRSKSLVAQTYFQNSSFYSHIKIQSKQNDFAILVDSILDKYVLAELARLLIKVKLFLVIVSTRKTEFFASKDKTQNYTDAVQQTCVVRYKIKDFYHNLRQLTGIEAFQFRKARI